MRNFIDLFSTTEMLTESRGLGARRSGEEFVSTTNPEDKIYVNSVTFYPQGGTAYPTYEAMVAELETVARGIPNADVDLIGKFKPTDRAFGVAVFDRDQGARRERRLRRVGSQVGLQPVRSEGALYAQ